MAKDGTNRGGRRVRSGDKPDALSDKIINGKAAKILEFEAAEVTENRWEQTKFLRKRGCG